MNQDVQFAFKKAHEIIWKLGYWKFLLVPIFLSAALAALMLGCCYLFSSAISDFLYPYLSEFFNLPEWVRTIFIIVIFAFQLGPCYVLFRSLVMVCYGPFLDRISKEAEEIVNGFSNEADTSFIDSIKRPILMTFYSIAGIAGVMVGAFALGLVPFVGVLLSGGFTMPANLFLSSISYIDPYLERSGYSPKQGFQLMWNNKITLIVFGLMGLLLTVIPLIGWFVGPTYSVVAGVILSIVLHNQQVESDAARQLS
ncbi:MAG: EI24 domain-containing protein [Opitutaceae bacterium]